MDVADLGMAAAVELTPPRFRDDRGWFSVPYSAEFAASLGWEPFVQDNESLSLLPGTIRGLHLQTGSASQAKLVRAVHGRAFDVLVDLRPTSPTWGQHATVTLDAALGNQVYVPRGFAHGICTLEPGTLIGYKVDNGYEPDAEVSIHYGDPDIGIEWPLVADAASLSNKDAAAPTLAELGGMAWCRINLGAARGR